MLKYYVFNFRVVFTNTINNLFSIFCYQLPHCYARSNNNIHDNSNTGNNFNSRNIVEFQTETRMFLDLRMFEI